MKKLFNLLLTIAMCFSLSACGEKKVQDVDATDTEKQAVILAAKECLASENYQELVELYETTTGSTAMEPEVFTALTFKLDDFEGYAVDFILFHIKSNIAIIENNEVIGFDDKILFAVDRETGNIYNSNTLREKMNNFITVESIEDVVALIFNNPVLGEGKDGYLWSEMEESTRFTNNDLKEINTAIKE